MSIPLFPTLTPKIVDSLWFSIDKPRNDESELVQLEQEHQSWLNSINQRDCELTPIGKSASECQDEEEEDEEEDDNDDDESDTHDEEDEDVEMELSYEVTDNRQMPPPADISI
ncbi:anaphase-promoting complex subunit 15B [Macrosteles quadrilineatus]|uniref:anaphase-promoting complex subunit 15B n=1 Tax=Macrosteles quadrilineatus TaxID=74068 RepID=UPI0023E0BAC0|nr:anaphase-promoting complex subunit 15B [Macrosteles quadrilineatus]